MPVAIQFAYYCILFAQPLAFKNDWNTDVHYPIVLRAELYLTLLSMGGYWYCAFVHYRSYQRWLIANVSQAGENRIEWVRNFLVALAITMLFWWGFALFDEFVKKLDYFLEFPFYLWLGVLIYYLGTEGHRNANHRYPVWEEVDAAATTSARDNESVVAPPLDVSAPKEAVDIKERAERWREKIVTAEWWRDPELTLAGLARKLGTNTTDLSRAINEGLGMNFNELINRMRVEEVRRNLAAVPTRNLLESAFAAGFSSKASFNRCFKLYTGQTPTDYRERNGDRS